MRDGRDSLAYRAAVLREAEAICRSDLTQEPARADMLHLRGMLAARQPARVCCVVLTQGRIT